MNQTGVVYRRTCDLHARSKPLDGAFETGSMTEFGREVHELLPGWLVGCLFLSFFACLFICCAGRTDGQTDYVDLHITQIVFVLFLFLFWGCFWFWLKRATTTTTTTTRNS